MGDISSSSPLLSTTIAALLVDPSASTRLTWVLEVDGSVSRILERLDLARGASVTHAELTHWQPEDSNSTKSTTQTQEPCEFDSCACTTLRMSWSLTILDTSTPSSDVWSSYRNDRVLRDKQSPQPPTKTSNHTMRGVAVAKMPFTLLRQWNYAEQSRHQS